jgi:hypothetical protein
MIDLADQRKVADLDDRRFVQDRSHDHQVRMSSFCFCKDTDHGQGRRR